MTPDDLSATEGKPEQFIAAIRDPALATDARTGIPAGFIIAQAALESGWGRYAPKDIETGLFSYNLFGIKALDGEPSVTVWTHEYIDGNRVRVKARFRAYGSYQESLDHHARLLTTPRYARCLPADDVAAYARCIHQAGYATDPGYADKLVRIMRTCGLMDLRAPRVPASPGCLIVVEGPGGSLRFAGRIGDDGRARLLDPLREFAEALGARVEWDEATRTVKVTRA